MGNYSLTFSVDVHSACDMSNDLQNLKEQRKTLDARLLAAYRKLVPAPAPPPDPLRQATLLTDQYLINERELAGRLSVSLSTVQHWRSGNEGPPYYRFGTAQRSPIRYLWPEVLVWLRETFWVRPAKPVLPHQTYFKAGKSIAWEYAKPSEALDAADDS